MFPIRWVGFTAAALVGVTYVLVIVMLPTLLSFGKDKQMVHDSQSGSVRAADTTQGHKGVDRLMVWLGNRVLNRPKLVLIVFCLTIVVCVVG